MIYLKGKILDILRESKDYVSGEKISEALSISRSAVWKHIKKLRADGYNIESATNRGYRLIEGDILNADEISRRLDTEFIGKNIVFFDETDSTNNAAKRQNAMPDGTLFIAEIQNGGKGRLGRAWVSPKGAGIWMTMLLKPELLPNEVSKITLIAGLAVCRALKKYGAAIKWPNDVIIGDKKISGTLTEMAAEIDSISYIVCGIGINVNTDSFEGELSKKATSLYIETGEKKNRADIVRDVLTEFERLYKSFLVDGLAGIKDEYEEHLANIGREVTAIGKNKSITGIAVGINENGELLIKTDSGITAVASGEVSVRGIYGYV